MLFENLAVNIDKRDVKDFRLAVPSSEGVFFFMIHEILRMEADRNYTIIHLINKRPFITSKTLKHFEDMRANSVLSGRISHTWSIWTILSGSATTTNSSSCRTARV